MHKPPLLKSKVAADEICHIENSQGLLESAFTVFCIRTAFQAQYIYIYIYYDPLIMSQKEAPRKHPWVLPRKVV